MERLRIESELKLCYVPLESLDSDLHIKIAFNNCKSLHLHFDDVKNDQGLLSCDVFALAESRLTDTDISSDYQIESFTCLRNDKINTSNSPSLSWFSFVCKRFSDHSF